MGTAKIRFLLTKSISQSFLNFLISKFHKMSYFMPYFDNLMKKLLLLAKNLSSQNWLSTKNSLSGAVTSMAVKDQLNIFRSFLQFFVSNFLWISYFMIYFDILIKNWAISTKRDGYGKNEVFVNKVDISVVFEFFNLKFSQNVLFHVIFW